MSTEPVNADVNARTALLIHNSEAVCCKTLPTSIKEIKTEPGDISLKPLSCPFPENDVLPGYVNSKFASQRFPSIKREPIDNNGEQFIGVPLPLPLEKIKREPQEYCSVDTSVITEGNGYNEGLVQHIPSSFLDGMVASEPADSYSDLSLEKCLAECGFLNSAVPCGNENSSGGNRPIVKTEQLDDDPNIHDHQVSNSCSPTTPKKDTVHVVNVPEAVSLSFSEFLRQRRDYSGESKSIVSWNKPPGGQSKENTPAPAPSIKPSGQTRNVRKNALTCVVCSKKFTTASKLKAHKVTHKAPRKRYKCTLCDRSFLHLKYLAAHETSHASQEVQEEFKCDVCDKTFNTACRLKLHQVTHQTMRIRHKCSFCDKSFLHLRYLGIHEKTHTSDVAEVLFKCQTCCKTFMTSSNLRIHMRKHTGPKDISCTMCSKKFYNRTDLKSHLRVHQEERSKLKCAYCDKMYLHRQTLLKHEKTHIGTIETDRRYVCEICNKRYYESHQLRIHLRTHTGEKPFECSMCNMSFVSSNVLRSHLLRKHDPTRKLFKCSSCNKTFITETRMLQHQESKKCTVRRPIRAPRVKPKEIPLTSHAENKVGNEKNVLLLILPRGFRVNFAPILQPAQLDKSA